MSHCRLPTHALILCCFELPSGASHPCQHACDLALLLIVTSRRLLTSRTVAPLKTHVGP